MTLSDLDELTIWNGSDDKTIITITKVGDEYIFHSKNEKYESVGFTRDAHSQKFDVIWRDTINSKKTPAKEQSQCSRLEIIDAKRIKNITQGGNPDYKSYGDLHRKSIF